MNTLDPQKPSGVWQALLPWFAQGARWTKPIGDMADEKIQAALDALRLRFPGVTPDDRSLALSGADRRIPRAPGEPAEAYARRLFLWLDLWGLAGQPLGLLYAIQSYIFPGYPLVRLIERSNLWHTLDEGASALMSPAEAATLPTEPPPGLSTSTTRYAPPVGESVSPRAAFWMHQASPANWDWDSISHPANASRWFDYWLMICPTSYPFQNVYDGATTYDSDTCWGLETQPGTIATLRELIRLYGRAGSHCVSVIFTPDTSTYRPELPASTDWPDGTWGWEVISDGMGGAIPAKSLINRYLLGFQ